MEIFKTVAVAVAAALCALILKREEPAQATVLALGAGLLLLWMGRDALARVKGFLDALVAASGTDATLWASVWRIVGIGLVTRLAAAVCRDAGEGGIAAFLETSGGAVALAAALPLAQLLLETLEGLL